MAINVVAHPVNLTWSYFHAVHSSPLLTGTEVAVISPQMTMPPSFHPVHAHGTYSLPALTMTVSVRPAGTLVLSSAPKTVDLLKHEQGHYDLLILVARATARELGAVSASSMAALSSLVQTVFSVHNGRAQALDSAYDTQTNHGSDTAQQAAWNMAIAAALASPTSTIIKGLPL